MGVRIETIGSLAALTIDRAPVNALDLDTLLELERAAAELLASPAAAVVLTGAGTSFSAGVDTRAFGAGDAAYRREVVLAITRMVAGFYALPKPMVAAVNGHAMGGGFVISLLADVRLCTDAAAARFGLQEAKAGVPFPVGPLEVIRAELAPETLRWLTLTGAAMTGPELVARGVYDRIVPAAKLAAEARAMAEGLAALPAHRQVKAQVRGPVIARLHALAREGRDPMVDQA